MIKELVQDEALLSVPCEAATPDDADVAQDLLDTLASLDGAACLCANQIGVPRAVVAWLDDDERPHVMYNPKLLLGLAAFKTTEACLTHEAETKVTRYAKIKVQFDELKDGAFKTRKADLADWEAQMVQHMIDHCKGKYL